MKKIMLCIVSSIMLQEASFASDACGVMVLPQMQKDSFSDKHYQVSNSVSKGENDLLKKKSLSASESISTKKQPMDDCVIILKDRMNDAEAQIESMLSGFGTPEENVKTVESIFERLSYYKSKYGEKLLEIPEVCIVLNMLASDDFFKYYESIVRE